MKPHSANPATAWTDSAVDRLRWACLGGASLDRQNAMQLLAVSLRLPYIAVYAKAQSLGLIGTIQQKRSA